jgi:hypothetical protein
MEDSMSRSVVVLLVLDTTYRSLIEASRKGTLLLATGISELKGQRVTNANDIDLTADRLVGTRNPFNSTTRLIFLGYDNDILTLLFLCRDEAINFLRC